MKSSLKILMMFVLVGFIGFAQAPENNKKLKIDESVRTGVLKNGMTYYIKKNQKPEDEVTLRLVVKAGSVLENEEQLGLAHFMEHMNFNGTKRFPENELVDYLQSIGVKFGNDLNAYTSFDETVYFLPIPLDDPKNLPKAMDIMEDWAFNAVLEPNEIDKERGVVLEELRLGLGAQERMRKQYFDKLLYKSRYAKRLPIGKKEILENFEYQELIDFYNDWYRPDMMAFIAVGDIDVDKMEKDIKKRFSKYKNPNKEKERKEYDVPSHDETFVAVATDKEATSPQVSLYYKNPKERQPVTTYALAKEQIKSQLFSTMLNNRLDEIANSPNPPFTFGFTYYGGLVNDKKMAFTSFAIPTNNDQLKALEVLLEENARVKKHGFTTGEFKRAKQEILKRLENQYKEREKTESNRFVGQLQQQFLSGDIYTGIEWDFQFTQETLPKISLDDINKMIDDYIRKDSRVVVFTGPEYKDESKKPTEEQILNIVNKDFDNISPYQESEISTSLVRKTLQPGKILATKQNDALGTTTLTLSNGTKVTYKKTDYKDDEILFEAVSYGGTNLLETETYHKVRWAMRGLSEAGYSGLNKNDISKFMSDKIARLNFSVSNTTERFNGQASPKDLEYLMQMLQAYFTDLNYNKEAFEGYKAKQKAFMSNMLASPNIYFLDKSYGFLNEDNPRWTGILPDDEAWEKTDYDLAYKTFKERFSNAADFHFYFVGNIDENQFKQLAEQYIAALPSNPDKKEKITDLGFRQKQGDFKKVFYKGNDPKSSVRIQFYGEAKYNQKEATALDALGEILTIKLVENLREEESGVYGVGANASMSKFPYGKYTLSIQFPCGPENAESLTQSALDELQKIIDNGPTEEDLNKYKKSQKVDHDENLKKNKYWLDQLTLAYYNQRSADSLLNKMERVNAVTAKDVQDVAKKYASGDKYIAMLMPESEK
ncbi:pitrilysin family protein [Flavobacterium sp. CS20]|uniref:M16 family metallopeptidase n=1 Tax=Flavobacterium sp. CS20 TaxID=2775246 RepID=UPI001B3A0ED4|nr:insulinase family protein [Flavobacterium sp. CS20]QTY27212.1 insulinase family protein [Flavobacterium sp. CS20]